MHQNTQKMPGLPKFIQRSHLIACETDHSTLYCPHQILCTLLPSPAIQNYNLKNRPHSRQHIPLDWLQFYVSTVVSWRILVFIINPFYFIAILLLNCCLSIGNKQICYVMLLSSPLVLTVCTHLNAVHSFILMSAFWVPYGRLSWLLSAFKCTLKGKWTTRIYTNPQISQPA